MKQSFHTVPLVQLHILACWTLSQTRSLLLKTPLHVLYLSPLTGTPTLLNRRFPYLCHLFRIRHILHLLTITFHHLNLTALSLCLHSLTVAPANVLRTFSWEITASTSRAIPLTVTHMMEAPKYHVT
ncbi:hypothetical protein M758_UG021800 [Ceratodon purpureus]|nr:hypothetical protein M758_UG021800 [Ceratodon purpureus]